MFLFGQKIYWVKTREPNLQKGDELFYGMDFVVPVVAVVVAIVVWVYYININMWFIQIKF